MIYGATTVGEPKTLPFDKAPCRCVKIHSPKINHTVRHHIVPQAWGGKDDASNLIDICPNTHSEVHRLLDEFVRKGGIQPKRRAVTKFVYGLAVRAWEGR